MPLARFNMIPPASGRATEMPPQSVPDRKISYTQAESSARAWQENKGGPFSAYDMSNLTNAYLSLLQVVRFCAVMLDPEEYEQLREATDATASKRSGD